MAEVTLKKISQVDNELLHEIVHRIVNAVQPDKIILFGSYAYGNPKNNSDLDILVIVPSQLPRSERTVAIYRCLAGLLIPKDIMVYTPEEVEEWSEVSQSFITTIIRQGKVIYEKESAGLSKKLA